MRLLITGGAGFIGRRVVAACLAAGHDVRVLDVLLPNVHAGREQPLLEGAELVVGDVRAEDTVRTALRGVDAVCHLAAMVGRGRDTLDAPGFTSHNDYGTGVLVAAMTEVGPTQLVLASSVVVYGEGRYQCAEHGECSPGTRDRTLVAAGVFDHHCPLCGRKLSPVQVLETAPLEPLSMYGASKVAQEHLIRAWAAHTGGSATALRYHQVYGPGMKRNSTYSGVACVFRSVVQRGDAPEVFEDGRMLRDFVHVDDVARATEAALGRRDPGFRAYNVASGQPRTVAEMAATMAEVAGAPAPVVTGRSRFDDLRHLVAAPERMAKELGWQAQVGFADGVREFVEAPMAD
ncbi:NAD-dependent epimerase/dehydratase family protein [Nucisporomicrobium flavum]|uniref:NAD-dependent epimerase/dehydratase family protein n=1 Tax=Nucisporomicrobium flavum TaxID=2785915 RepID=UPI0018F7BCAF|nr:NAD-dependent epimerase/dehydratase family protein [Nucisporomicrobium flavum]